MADSYPVEEPDDPVEFKGTKPVRLSLHLIVKRHLPDEANQWSQERIITELNKIKRVRLDRENIGQIDSMELLSSEVTNLYLQSNQIKSIENLECLPNLQVLVLCRNQLTSVDGISHLQRLVFLDLSENDIEFVDPGSFPKSIVILNLKENPCASQRGHRFSSLHPYCQIVCQSMALRPAEYKTITNEEGLQSSLPKLKQLNGVDFIAEDFDSDELDSDDEISDNMSDNSDSNIQSTNENNSREPGVSASLSLRSNYTQLPTIQSSISDITTEMLMRSQNRLEEVGMQHKRHIQEMTNIKIKTKIRPLPNISKPS